MFPLVPQIFIKQFIVYYYKADHVLIYVLDFFAVPRQIENLLGLRDRQTLRLVTPQRRIKGDFELIPWRSIRQFPSQLDPFSVVRTQILRSDGGIGRGPRGEPPLAPVPLSIPSRRSHTLCFRPSSVVEPATMTAEDTAAGGELEEDYYGGGNKLPAQPRSSGMMHRAAVNHHHCPPTTTMAHPSHSSSIKASRAASYVQYTLEPSSGGTRVDPRWILPQGEEEELGWQQFSHPSPPPPHDDRWSPSSTERSRTGQDYNESRRRLVGFGWDSAPHDDNDRRNGGGGGEYLDDDDYVKQASVSYLVEQWEPVPPRHAQPVLVEVAPGIRAPLRGSDETWQALQDDFYVPGLCWICDETVFVIQDAAFVLCPDCKTVSPVEGDFIDRLAAGVGLGFKYETLVRWQDELIERRRRRWL